MKIFLLLTLFLSFPLYASTIAVVNFKVIGDQSLKNHMERIDSWAEKAQAKKAEFLLLPELMVLDFFPKNPDDKKISEYLEKVSKMSPEYEKGLKEIGKKYSLNLIGASSVIKTQNGFINRAYFVKEDGEVSYQDKLYPTPWEMRHHFVKTNELKIFKTKEFSFAILICHDSEFPSVSAELNKSKPEVIFVSSQTDDMDGLYRVKFTSQARAVEHMAYVLMTGTTGDKGAPWHSYAGQNFLFTPKNKYFEHKDFAGKLNQEELSVFELDLKKLKKSRSDKKQVYPARDV